MRVSVPDRFRYQLKIEEIVLVFEIESSRRKVCEDNENLI